MLDMAGLKKMADTYPTEQLWEELKLVRPRRVVERISERKISMLEYIGVIVLVVGAFCTLFTLIAANAKQIGINTGKIDILVRSVDDVKIEIRDLRNTIIRNEFGDKSELQKKAVDEGFVKTASPARITEKGEFLLAGNLKSLIDKIYRKSPEVTASEIHYAVCDSIGMSGLGKIRSSFMQKTGTECTLDAILGLTIYYWESLQGK